MFGRLKNWRRFVTRQSGGPTAFVFAIMFLARALVWV